MVIITSSFSGSYSLMRWLSRVPFGISRTYKKGEQLQVSNSPISKSKRRHFRSLDFRFNLVRHHSFGRLRSLPKVWGLPGAKIKRHSMGV